MSSANQKAKSATIQWASQAGSRSRVVFVPRWGLSWRGARSNKGPVLVAIEEVIEPLDEPVVLGWVGLLAVLDVGADENQTAGAVLAVGG